MLKGIKLYDIQVKKAVGVKSIIMEQMTNQNGWSVKFKKKNSIAEFPNRANSLENENIETK